MKRSYMLYIKTFGGTAICLALIFFFIIPTYQSIRTLKEEIYENNVALEQKKQTQQNFSSIKTEFQKVQDDSKKLEHAFLSKDTSSILQTIESLENLAVSHNVTQNLTIDPIPESENDPLISSKITLTLDGTFESLYMLIKEFEDLPYYINIDSFTISSATDGSYNATLLGNVYWL